MTHGNDYETFRMATKILREEIEHEEEIGCFKDDINALAGYKNEMQD